MSWKHENRVAIRCFNCRRGYKPVDTQSTDLVLYYTTVPEDIKNLCCHAEENGWKDGYCPECQLRIFVKPKPRCAYMAIRKINTWAEFSFDFDLSGFSVKDVEEKIKEYAEYQPMGIFANPVLRIARVKIEEIEEEQK